MISLVHLLYVFVVISLLLYFYSKWKYNYWKKIGLYSLEPQFFFGNVKSLVKKEISYGDQFDIFYKDFKSKGLSGGGIYNLFTPVFIPSSLELVQCILHKDFSYFPNHGAYVNEEKDPLTGNLFFLENEKWKNLRAKLTPTFTSGKMKLMFPIMLESTNSMMEIVANHATTKEPLDIKELMLRFTKDVIGSIAFGIDCNTLKDSNSSFNEYTKKFFNLNISRLLNIALGQLLSRDILSRIGYRFIPKYIEDFFLNLVRQTIEHREKNNISRSDFLQILIELKNNKEHEKLNSEIVDNSSEFNINNIAANVFIFFVAGVETTANTVSFCLMELALNQDVQEKVRKEVNTVVKNYNGEMTYDALMEMKYLEQAVLETLRKHPTAQKFHRECIKPYKIPDTDITLEVGTKVIVPVYSIHRDPEYFPEPDRFDPDRFTPENKAKMDSGCFLGFGEGPRHPVVKKFDTWLTVDEVTVQNRCSYIQSSVICETGFICNKCRFRFGVRMGKMQTKIALAKIISNFRVSINDKMKLPIEYGFNIVGAAIKGGIWINIEKI